MRYYKNFIDGKWVSSSPGKTFDDVNPADTRQTIGKFPKSSSDDVNTAVESARKHFDSWRHLPAPKRGEILYRFGQILVQHKEEMARLMTQEMGKILKETRGDVQEAIDMAFYTAGEGRRLFGQTTPSELRDKAAFSVRMPIGVCGIITPWNFPAAIPSWKILPALICGNTVVFKPASWTPATAARFVELLDEAGVPPGIVNLVHGSGDEVGSALIHHPEVDLISFTGSCQTGRKIAEVCGRGLKKYSLEMGGKNAQIVMEDADLELAIEGALWGAFGTTGQRCTATSRLIVHQKIESSFTKGLLKRIKGLKVGNGLNPKTEMGPLISQSQLENVRNYVHIGIKEGAKLLYGGERLTKGSCRHGFFYQPTLFSCVEPDMRIAQEEIFGPVTAIISVKSFEEAITVMNSTSYGLSSSIYTRDVNRAFKAIEEVQAGITYINSPTIGAEVHLPFGGIKNTGNGHREAGATALDIFSEWKAVYVDYSGHLQKAQINE